MKMFYRTGSGGQSVEIEGVLASSFPIAQDFFFFFSFFFRGEQCVWGEDLTTGLPRQETLSQILEILKRKRFLENDIYVMVCFFHFV